MYVYIIYPYTQLTLITHTFRVCFLNFHFVCNLQTHPHVTSWSFVDMRGAEGLRHPLHLRAPGWGWADALTSGFSFCTVNKCPFSSLFSVSFCIFVIYVGDFTGQSGPKHRDGTLSRVLPCTLGLVFLSTRRLTCSLREKNVFDKLHSDVLCSTVGREFSVTESTI